MAGLGFAWRGEPAWAWPGAPMFHAAARVVSRACIEAGRHLHRHGAQLRHRGGGGRGDRRPSPRACSSPTEVERRAGAAISITAAELTESLEGIAQAAGW